jgi:hypothetical protein
MHVIVDHAAGNGSHPSKHRVNPVVNWWRDTFVSISITVDSMLAPLIKIQGCEVLKLLPCDLVVAAISNTIPE